MLGSESFHQEDTYCIGDAETNEATPKAYNNAFIPKIEPVDNVSYAEEEYSEQEISQPIIPYTAPYKLKDPIILVERCDKIWKTLKLIKNAHSSYCDVSLNSSAYSEDKVTNTTDKDVNKTAENELPYIQYQPALGNDGKNPNDFKLSIKSMQQIYSCDYCEVKYVRKCDITSHMRRKHGEPRPDNRQRATKKESIKNTDKVQKTEAVHSGILKYPNEKTQTSEINKPKMAVRPIVKQKVLPVITSVQKVKKVHFSLNEDHKGETKKVCEVTSSVEDKPEEKNVKKCDDVICTLCNHVTNNIRNHFRTYHKIASMDTMFEKFVKPIPAKQNENKNVDKKDKMKLKGAETDETSTKKPPENKIRNRRKRKRKSSGSHVPAKKRAIGEHDGTINTKISAKELPDTKTGQKYRCGTCCSFYNSKQELHAHQNTHILPPNENPGVMPNEQDPSTVVSTTNDSLNGMNTDNNSVTNTECVDDKLPEQQNDPNCDKNTGKGKSLSPKCTCNCGRTFRNAYTLFTHKLKCRTQQADTTEEVTSDHHQDSAVNINITIKKSNNSYEIVEKEKVNNSKAVSHIESKAVSESMSRLNSTLESDQTYSRMQEMYLMNESQYSKDHIMLKLQNSEEDILIDIEDDSTSNADESESCAGTSTKPEDEKSGKENIPTDNIHKVIAKVKPLSSDALKQDKNIEEKDMIDAENQSYDCVCGKTYPTDILLNSHIDKCHPLLLKCGYCKTTFKNTTEVDNHICSVVKGEAINCRQISCCYCNAALTFSTFDAHMQEKHLESTPNNFHCYECKQSFTSNTLRLKHIRSSHSEMKCSVCCKKFSITYKRMHEAYHFGLGYPCHICKRTFVRKKSIKKHVTAYHAKNASGETLSRNYQDELKC